MKTNEIPSTICIWQDQMKDFLAGKRNEVMIGINQDRYEGALYYVNKDKIVQFKNWCNEHGLDYVVDALDSIITS